MVNEERTGMDTVRSVPRTPLVRAWGGSMSDAAARVGGVVVACPARRRLARRPGVGCPGESRERGPAAEGLLSPLTPPLNPLP